LPDVRRSRLDRFWRVLLAIVAVAFVVRVGYVALGKRGPCKLHDFNGAVVGTYDSECTGTGNAASDQVFYNAEADAIADGFAFTGPFPHPGQPGVAHPPTAEHPPLTVMVLAPVSWSFERPPLKLLADETELANGETVYTHVREQRYTMAVLGTVLVLLIGLLGRGIGGPTVGWVAAGIAALYPGLWVTDGLIMSETVTGIAVVGALLFALRVLRSPTWGSAIGLGVFAGLATLGRAELVLFVPLLVLPVAFLASRARRLTLAALGIAGALVVVGPWVGYNLARFDERTFVSTNDGIALAGSNCDHVYYGGSIGLTYLFPPCLDSPAPPGDESVVAKIYRTRAIDYMKTHKREAVKVIGARIGRTWSLFRPMDMLVFNRGEGRERWAIASGLWSYYALLGLAVAGGFVLAARSWRRWWVLLVPAIVSTIGVAVTYGQTRFRAAAEPSLVVFAAVAVVALATQLRTTSGPAADGPTIREPVGARQ
jgi:dolichyl-phosphate-mannose-protein mannosyltransferase